jgi:excisionase family DNA binding protein
MEKLLTPKELQTILGLGKSIIYRMLASGAIPSILVTNGHRRRSFRVRIKDLEKWMKAREVSNYGNF